MIQYPETLATTGLVGEMVVDDLTSVYALAGPSEGASRELREANFDRLRFDRLLFGPGTPEGGLVTVSRCSFIKCKVDGSFRIAHGVQMDDVLFEDMRSPDAMIINTQTVLSRVVITGGKNASSLWVKPSETERSRPALAAWLETAPQNEFALDFSNLQSHAEVVGLPLSRLRWNPEFHVPLTLDWVSNPTWSNLGLTPNGFWERRVLRLRDSGCTEGVFTLPDRSSKLHNAAMKELDGMQAAGFVKLPWGVISGLR
jgi:hypothetical protein